VAKPAGKRLKVFQAQFGFYDTVVAAPSQGAALRAWGIRQNLFASGEARLTTDNAAVAAATAHPETPLRRAVGSDDPFVLEPTGLPNIPDAPKKPAAKVPAKPPTAAPASPPVDRSKLAEAEQALRALDHRRKNEEADFRREADDFDARRQIAQSTYVEHRKAATAAVVEARKIYRETGGRD
jgi:hypothetical protein